jgi:hypothetical protein
MIASPLPPPSAVVADVRSASTGVGVALWSSPAASVTPFSGHSIGTVDLTSYSSKSDTRSTTEIVQSPLTDIVAPSTT